MSRILYVACGFDGGKSGISVYMNETLRRLAARHELLVVTTAFDRMLLPELPGVRYHTLPRLLNRPVFNMLYIWGILPFRFSPKKFDYLLLPAANRRAPGFHRFFTVATVHDLSQYHVPCKYDRFRLFYIRRILPCAVRKADRIVAISSSTAADLEEHWNVERAKITVCFNGFDAERFQPHQEPGERETLQQKFGLHKPYILYISRIEHPGKNHLRLIEAYESLPTELRDQYDLVLAGSLWSGAETVLEHLEKSPCRDRIRLIGFVPQQELPALYRQAALYAFPSLFEGFGLSIPEAFGCGTPVVCSNNSSLGEIAGEAARSFDPENTGEIAHAMQEMLTDAELRKTMRERGFQRVKLFSWDRHVETLERLGESRFRKRNRLLGVQYDNVTEARALALIDRAAAGKSAPLRGAFVNADCFNQAWHNAAYRNTLASFDAVFPDGSGVAMAGRILKTPVRGNVNGTDLLPYLAELAAKRDFSIYLFGAKPGVAEKMRQQLLMRWPKLRFVGVRDGYTPEGVVEEIAAARPDILLVALGVPLQEEFIRANFAKLNCRVALGVGGLFDFYSGNIPRAPRWMRTIGMEWSFRLLMEPRRLFRRYILGNPLFLWRVVRFGENHPATNAPGERQLCDEDLMALLLARADKRRRRIPRKLQRWNLTIKTAYGIKRFFDIVLTLTALFLLSPLLLAVVIWIKLDSEGPVIYRQIRVGKNGKHFSFYKFRSMYVDADRRKAALMAQNESSDGVIFKMKKDPRITRPGRFIRKFSIDELPQLFNVLIGDMSLVGPRPPLPAEVSLYTLEDRKRLHVIPGITCIWQVSGRSDIPFKEQVELDKEYIKSQSAWRDFVLLLKTIPAVLTGKGAY